MNQQQFNFIYDQVMNAAWDQARQTYNGAAWWIRNNPNLIGQAFAWANAYVSSGINGRRISDVLTRAEEMSNRVFRNRIVRQMIPARYMDEIDRNVQWIGDWNREFMRGIDSADRKRKALEDEVRKDWKRLKEHLPKVKKPESVKFAKKPEIDYRPRSHPILDSPNNPFLVENSLPKENNMHGTPRRSHGLARSTPSSRGSHILSTPYSHRSVSHRGTPRRHGRIARGFGSRHIRRRRALGFKEHTRSVRKSSSRTKVESGKRLFRKKRKFKKVRVSKSLARKVKKILSKKRAVGKHYTLEFGRFDLNTNNRLGWLKTGFFNYRDYNGNVLSFDPNTGLTGEFSSPAEILRKCNEIWMAKRCSDVSYYQQTIQGGMSSVNFGGYQSIGFNAAQVTENAGNMMPIKADDTALGYCPKIEVLKNYVVTEIANQTQRTMHIDIYEVKSKKSGSHGVIGDPFTQFVTAGEMKNNIFPSETDNIVTTNTNIQSPLLYYYNPVNNASRTFSKDDGTVPAQVTDVTQSALYVTPELFSDWNKNWAVKKTRITLEPGQATKHYTKGFTGTLNFRKLFVPAFQNNNIIATPLNNYMFKGVVKGMNTWIFASVSCDLIGTQYDGTPNNNAIRQGRLDFQTALGGYGCVFETKQVFKARCPEGLEAIIQGYAVDANPTGGAGHGYQTAALPLADPNTTQQGGITPFQFTSVSRLIDNMNLPRTIMYNKVDDQVYINHEQSIRVDSVNPGAGAGAMAPPVG